jgi:pyruvate carboxylase
MNVSLSSVLPTRYFLGRPATGEEMHISIEKGKTLIIRLMAVGPVVEGRAQRDVWFEVNGEVGMRHYVTCEYCADISLSRRFGLYPSKTRILQ